MNPLFQTLPTSIFAHMSALAVEHGAVNLGQGFPDFGWPEDVVSRAADALRGGSNQYAPMRGLPELRRAVADHYRHHQWLSVDPEWITVTSGATEALAAAIMALVSAGDEVVLIQPLYDAYLPLVLRAGGVPKLVRLEPPEWRITAEALDAAFSPRTRLVIVNNPHNPTARVFGRDELALIAERCIAAGAVAISDEVWEHLVFDGAEHIPLASLPGMAERTVKVGSAGKIFSLTGWKVGWIVAPPVLGEPISKAHQYFAYATPPNLQAAVAYGMAKEDAYYAAMRGDFVRSRDWLDAALRDAGFGTLRADGTYFLNVDLAASGIALGDTEFCERAVREAGVAAIPLSAFYAQEPATNVIRLCFAKKAETLEKGVSALGAARELLGG
ncbi:MAG TPA: aminotransferase [Allosphingosinicella sp.]|jgi:aspartate/methionine/tyrosine aminotransferase